MMIDGLIFLRKSLVVLVVVSIIMTLNPSISFSQPEQNPGAHIISILDTDVDGTTPQSAEPKDLNTLKSRLISLCRDMIILCLKKYLETRGSLHLGSMDRLYTQTPGPEESGIQKQGE